MTKFIVLHSWTDDSAVHINVDHIAHFEANNRLTNVVVGGAAIRVRESPEAIQNSIDAAAPASG